MSKIVSALQKLNGIGATEAAALAGAGIKSFAELRSLSGTTLIALIGSTNATKVTDHLTEIVKAVPNKAKLRGYS